MIFLISFLEEDLNDVELNFQTVTYLIFMESMHVMDIQYKWNRHNVTVTY